MEDVREEYPVVMLSSPGGETGILFRRLDEEEGDLFFLGGGVGGGGGGLPTRKAMTGDGARTPLLPE